MEGDITSEKLAELNSTYEVEKKNNVLLQHGGYSLNTRKK